MDINYIYIKKVKNIDNENYSIKFEVINKNENYSCQSVFTVHRDISHLIMNKIEVRNISKEYDTVYDLVSYIIKEY